jgi:subtilisin family serine protease
VRRVPPVASFLAVCLWLSVTAAAKTMAADQARAATSGLLGIGSYPAVTGRGVGVAVVDSGIAAHAALAQKVVAAVSFVTGDPSTDDGFGHGTHVAGIIAGAESPAAHVTSLYKGGIAPGAHLINVRVLGREGSGYTTLGQQIIWGDKTQGQQIIWGDQYGSAGQQIIWGDADTSNGNLIIWGESVPEGSR